MVYERPKVYTPPLSAKEKAFIQKIHNLFLLCKNIAQILSAQQCIDSTDFIDNQQEKLLPDQIPLISDNKLVQLYQPIIDRLYIGVKNYRSRHGIHNELENQFHSVMRVIYSLNELAGYDGNVFLEERIRAEKKRMNESTDSN